MLTSSRQTFFMCMVLENNKTLNIARVDIILKHNGTHVPLEGCGLGSMSRLPLDQMGFLRSHNQPRSSNNKVIHQRLMTTSGLSHLFCL